MEDKNQTINPVEKKSSGDFVKLLVGIVLLIAVLVALKYAFEAFGFI
ncbi:hypothetical protein [Maribellus sediminis]|nr:hypothetical protein [Maribellus sediminis]